MFIYNKNNDAIYLNRKTKKLFLRFLTLENSKQSNSQLYVAFIKFRQDLKNNPNMLKRGKFATSAINSDVGISLNLLRNNHR
jgi:hypothetical protein